MSNKLFSEDALSEIKSPEQLDQHIKIIKPNSWAILVAFLAILVAVIIWMFFGNVVDGENVKGIIFPEAGITYINAEDTGVVSDVLVSEGDYVEAGQTVMVIYNKDAIAQINQLKDHNEDASEKIIEYESMAVVKSEVSGIVQTIVSKNESILKSQKVATIINENGYTNNKELIAYIPLSIVNKFKVGMEAQVSPTYAPREEYGYMKGYITRIGELPVTDAVIIKTLGNVDSVKDILPEENVVEIRIALFIDSTSKNTFLWSNLKGKDISVDTNTLCNVLIILENNNPIELLFK